mgnify:CR=1 FL=1
MVKIVQRRSLGLQPVYDIGVARDHNFLLAAGLVASNCFNKSHSTAYGYVTYQTAYLKANYPVEYMAALLTSNSGDQDKVQQYLAACIGMGIEIESPDLNRSGMDFTPYVDEAKPTNQRILFGLSAVRNVGAGAVEHLLAERDRGGVYESLADLCDRIDTRAVNRRALEALIQCGAMDQFHPEANRQQLIKDMELVLDWAQSRARDREIGQGNLFDLFNSDNGDDGSTTVGLAAPTAPPTTDYPKQERLRLEKELLGFYVSDHPLKSLQKPARILAPVNVSDMGEQPDNTTISAIVMLSMVQHKTTKKGDAMAVMQIEDLTGRIDAIVFPKTYSRVREHVQSDLRAMVWGKVDRRDEQTQFIIDDIEPIEHVRMVMVDIPAQEAGDITVQHRLRTVLQQQKGENYHDAKVPVIAMIRDAQQQYVVRLGSQFRVQDDAITVQELQRAGFSARAEALPTV